MRARLIRIATIAIAVVAAMSISGPIASADGGAKTKVTLKKLSATGASGKVSSSRSSCLPNRKVSVFIYDGFITDKVGITYTNGKGEWKLKKKLKPGTYFAKVDASKGCRYDVSRRKKLRP